MFCFLHDIGHAQLQRICSHVDENLDSIKPRGHGNKAKLPHNTTEFQEIEHIRDFILNTGRVRGMPLPGRLPGLRETEAYYLPADETQIEVYKQYKVAAEGENRTPVKYSTFRNFWHDLVPDVKILTPSTDLCDVCQENSKKLAYSGHLSEEEKRERLEDSLVHLNAAKVEREYYNRQVMSARDGNRKSHISFDYAQQIHYPYNCQKVGSAFFKTPRKCGIFGICEESPEDKQVNYLIDEADMVGKGSNVVVSMIHHYLSKHWKPAPVLLLHADNCVGQNKNNTVIQYLMWHLLTSETERIEISFMVSGHTKFAPDRHFGLIKKKYSRSVVDTMEDVQKMVIESSPGGHNLAQPIRNPRTDEMYVHWYDWTNFLKMSFKSIPSITKYHHFRMDKDNPGQVKCSLTPEGEEDVMKIMTVSMVDSSSSPQALQSEGLSAARQQYLYQHISPLCSSKLAASITCPRPDA